MTIRLARPDDFPAVLELSRELMRLMTELEPAMFLPMPYSDGYLDSILADEKQDVLVAELDGNVVGYALVQDLHTPDASSLRPVRYTYLLDFSVSPECRGRGVGSALFDRVKEWAAARSAAYIELSVLTKNRRSLELYERLGFRNVIRVMRLGMESPDAPCT